MDEKLAYYTSHVDLALLQQYADKGFSKGKIAKLLNVGLSNLKKLMRIKGIAVAPQKGTCQNCGLTKWLGQDIILVFDHLNGDDSDDQPDNVRLICPNCKAYYNGRDRLTGKFCKNPHEVMKARREAEAAIDT